MSDLKKLRQLMNRTGESKIVVSDDGDTYLVMTLEEFEALAKKGSLTEATAQPRSEAGTRRVSRFSQAPERKTSLVDEAWIERELAEAAAVSESEEPMSAEVLSREDQVRYEETDDSSEQKFFEEPV